MTVTVCTGLPLVPAPVIVSVYVPEGVVRAVVMLSFELVPVVVVGLDENVPVTPDGKPLRVKPTWPVKPFTRVIVIE